MASDNEASCESDPNFAVICAFLEKFGVTCGLSNIDFLELQGMLENTQEVSQVLIDLHIKLLRKARKSVSNERWERAVIKFCHGFCIQDAWEIERFGYKKARISSKLRILKELLELQFDYNGKFKTEINKSSAEELRSQPLGRDKSGHSYWFQSDDNYQIRVYKEDLDEETWTLVAKDREGLVSLITDLGDGDSKTSSDSAANEDSNSLSEKPIIDTGQTDSNSSDSKKSLEDSEDSSQSKKILLPEIDDVKTDLDTPKDEIAEEDISNDDDDDDSKNIDGNQNSRPTLRIKALSELVSTDGKGVKRSRDEEYETYDTNQEVIKKLKLKNLSRGLIVDDAIEEPVMLVKGEGSGQENEGIPLIFGDVIEEDIFYVYGEGSGQACFTGNENKTSSEKSNEDNTIRRPESVQSASQINSTTDNSISASDSINISDSKDNNAVPTCNIIKNPYKLGTIIDTKTDKVSPPSQKSPTKKSRWDVEEVQKVDREECIATGVVKDLVSKFEQSSSKTVENEVENVPVLPKQPMFFFGRGSFPFKSNMVPTSLSMAFGSTSTSKKEQKPPEDNLQRNFENIQESASKIVNIPSSINEKQLLENVEEISKKTSEDQIIAVEFPVKTSEDHIMPTAVELPANIDVTDKVENQNEVVLNKEVQNKDVALASVEEEVIKETATSPIAKEDEKNDATKDIEDEKVVETVHEKDENEIIILEESDSSVVPDTPETSLDSVEMFITKIKNPSEVSNEDLEIDGTSFHQNQDTVSFGKPIEESKTEKEELSHQNPDVIFSGKSIDEPKTEKEEICCESRDIITSGKSIEEPERLIQKSSAQTEKVETFYESRDIITSGKSIEEPERLIQKSSAQVESFLDQNRKNTQTDVVNVAENRDETIVLSDESSEASVTMEIVVPKEEESPPIRTCTEMCKLSKNGEELSNEPIVLSDESSEASEPVGNLPSEVAVEQSNSDILTIDDNSENTVISTDLIAVEKNIVENDSVEKQMSVLYDNIVDATEDVTKESAKSTDGIKVDVEPNKQLECNLTPKCLDDLIIEKAGKSPQKTDLVHLVASMEEEESESSTEETAKTTTKKFVKVPLRVSRFLADLDNEKDVQSLKLNESSNAVEDQASTSSSCKPKQNMPDSSITSLKIERKMAPVEGENEFSMLNINKQTPMESTESSENEVSSSMEPVDDNNVITNKSDLERKDSLHLKQYEIISRQDDFKDNRSEELRISSTSKSENEKIQNDDENECKTVFEQQASNVIEDVENVTNFSEVKENQTEQINVEESESTLKIISKSSEAIIDEEIKINSSTVKSGLQEISIIKEADDCKIEKINNVSKPEVLSAENQSDASGDGIISAITENKELQIETVDDAIDEGSKESVEDIRVDLEHAEAVEEPVCVKKTAYVCGIGDRTGISVQSSSKEHELNMTVDEIKEPLVAKQLNKREYIVAIESLKTTGVDKEFRSIAQDNSEENSNSTVEFQDTIPKPSKEQVTTVPIETSIAIEHAPSSNIHFERVIVESPNTVLTTDTSIDIKDDNSSVLEEVHMEPLNTVLVDKSLDIIKVDNSLKIAEKVPIAIELVEKEDVKELTDEVESTLIIPEASKCIEKEEVSIAVEYAEKEVVKEVTCKPELSVSKSIVGNEVSTSIESAPKEQNEILITKIENKKQIYLENTEDIGKPVIIQHTKIISEESKSRSMEQAISLEKLKIEDQTTGSALEVNRKECMSSTKVDDYFQADFNDSNDGVVDLSMGKHLKTEKYLESPQDLKVKCLFQDVRISSNSEEIKFKVEKTDKDLPSDQINIDVANKSMDVKEIIPKSVSTEMASPKDVKIPILGSKENKVTVTIVDIVPATHTADQLKLKPEEPCMDILTSRGRSKNIKVKDIKSETSTVGIDKVFQKSPDEKQTNDDETKKRETPKVPVRTTRNRKTEVEKGIMADECASENVQEDESNKPDESPASSQVVETLEESKPTIRETRITRGRLRKQNENSVEMDGSEEITKKIKLSEQEPVQEEPISDIAKMRQTRKPKFAMIEGGQKKTDFTNPAENIVKPPDLQEKSVLPEKVNDVVSVESSPMCSPHSVVNLADSPESNLEVADEGNHKVADKGNLDVANEDPLALCDAEIKMIEQPKTKPISLATFSMDFTESPTPTPPLPVITRALRKRGRESPDNKPDVEETGSKKMKMKAKRVIDTKLRKSIEAAKEEQGSSSDDDDNFDNSVGLVEVSEDEAPKPVKPKKSKGKSRRKGKKAKSKKMETVDDDSKVDDNNAAPVEKKSKKDAVNKNKRILGNLGLSADQLVQDAPIIGVRQSRRLAQLKIREQAEIKKAEEKSKEDIMETKKKHKIKKSDEDKDYKAEKRKRGKHHEEDDFRPEPEVEKKKAKKKKKYRDPRKLFDENKPWKSSSDSSSSMEEEEEEIIEYEDEEPLLDFKSDHEFSPESDLENDDEVQPLKRARTARKESDVEEVDDCPCQKCGKSDHPEWILLCDKCDNGWHCSCLRPPLLVIPEGDWFCPPCQHFKLLENLQLKLVEYDKKLSKKEIEDRRKERLAYVGISLNNVLPTRDPEQRRKRQQEESGEKTESSSEESESSSASGSESESDSDEPIYQLRQRRQAQSYKFNDYDELIKSAIQDEMEAVKGAGNQGRGKDIATIVNAEREEEVKHVTADNLDPEPKPPVVPKEDPVRLEDNEAESEDEPIRAAKKKLIGRKKHRKLNSLDISSDDDADSDEDFKGTSSESEEDEFDEDLGSDTDDYVRGGKRRKNAGPIRRSTRARVSRYDADFINDGTDSEDDDAPRKKKKRAIWDESASEESDRSWGRRKRRQNRPQVSRTSKKKKSKKKKKVLEDSDVETFRKKKPKIKYGGLESSDEDVGGRRTRGKKTTYVDTLGSDSEEEQTKKFSRRIESDEDEYVVNDEEDEEKDSEEEEVDEQNEEDSSENVPLQIPKIKVHIKPSTTTEGGQTQEGGEEKSINVVPETNKPEIFEPKTNIPLLELAKIRPTDEEEDATEVDAEPNTIEQMNKNLEEMDEDEMEKMMEEEEYANKQLQLMALQLEKEKKRKEREAKKMELVKEDEHLPKKRGRKPKFPTEFPPPRHEPIVGNVAALLHNDESNDELSEPPGVSLPLFAELASTHSSPEELSKKRRGRGKGKKTLEETLANLGSVREQKTEPFNLGTKPIPENPQGSNIEIAAPPQPFSQSQPLATPSVITRMLQSKPVQSTTYPVGTIRPKQFATMADSDAEEPRSRGSSPAGVPPRLHGVQPSPGQFVPGGPRGPMPSTYRHVAPVMNHYPRGVLPPPHQLRGPAPPGLPPHIFHTHRSLDPSPSGGGPINMSDHSSTLVSASSNSPSNKSEPPAYSRPPVSRFPTITNAPMTSTAPPPRPLHMMSHIGPRPSTNLSPYPNAPPGGYYGSYPSPTMSANEDALPPTAYQSSPYSEQFAGDVGANPSENSNSKSFDEESGGEFGGLVSYFSSQREDDLS